MVEEQEQQQTRPNQTNAGVSFEAGIHKQLSLSMGSQNFFKIILQSSIDENKLQLPNKFVRNHGDKLGTEVTFKVPDGKTWKIKVGNTTDGLTWFRQGFSAFAAYYSISHAYLLVFKYKGNSCFHVRIYAPHACEIVYPTGGGDHERPNVPVKNEDEDKEEASGARILTTVATSFKQIRNKATGSEQRTINAAMELRLENPSFTLVIRPYNFAQPVGYVPGKFANAHLRPDCSYMDVRDSSDSKKKWVIQLNWRERGGLNLGLGWGVFKAENNLMPGDVCLFELVDPRQWLVKAHIFRVSAH
ncbi:B3 domain-containing protein At1g49475 [Linum grandiflorum]